MQIDPVVFLAQKIVDAERALRDARLRRDEKMTTRWLAVLSMLNEDLYTVVPTSPLGAAELLRKAAASLGGAWAIYAAHMGEIAERLSNGSRALDDLVWLRSMRPALSSGLCGNDGVIVAPLVALAIRGASRPVVVFRAVFPPRNDDGWGHAASRSP
ncbi:MAG: hypothetical protein WDN01_10315 [Rhizomicrobium sp.]